ncbi:MAG: D-alanyl-D-alanine carboxypeptidase/D-alanyl-D-alanine-endopeptidase [Bacteroidetes bacterium]|nr:D-alanyl-D-alanine carboxypeptidase/D-alanyl-D-alanine-endopeptidase [Bacteroidota bacterium]MBS1669972.1 D-alanyl-D-alanine carboxypeptidase/D-alanyl-D-alanine-endopeptidase [Bacteroidota bacterium]
MKREYFNSFIKLVAGCLLFYSCSVQKQISKQAQQSILSDSNFSAAHVGIALFDVEKQQYVYNYQSNKYFVPASNTKLLTCYVAMKYLGDSLVGLKYINDENEYTVKFTGDPTLLHPDFKQHPVYDFFKKNHDNITVIPADWETAKYGSGWAWNDYDADYMPERSAMPVYGNTVRFSKKSNAITAMPKIFQDSLLMLADTRQNNFKIVRDENANNFTVKASNTKFNGAEIPFITSFDLGIKLLQDSLHNDITAIDAEVKNIGWKNLYSQPTDSLLKIMMHRSDNFFAEQTLLMVSNERLGYMNDRKIIDTILKTDYAAMPQKPRWVDGSGLSRYDLVTPQDFVFVLNKMKQEFNWNRITSILQTGNQGTLTGLYKNYAGKIYAKTGTLSGVVALSGYIITNKGKQYIFSLLVNSHQTSASNIRKGFEKFITEIINKY